MIQVPCPNCGVKLNAKEKLAGQTRKCPKCGGPVVIPVPAPAKVEATVALVDAPPDVPIPIILPDADAALPPPAWLPRLSHRNRYAICDETSVVATWQGSGQGWMLRVASGFSPARRNREILPAFGRFVLVEFDMESTDAGLHLASIEVYQLASRAALPKLALGDDEILEAVTERAGLNRAQKNAIRHVLGEFFMRDVWGDSSEVLEYLANADYHSHTSRTEEPSA